MLPFAIEISLILFWFIAFALSLLFREWMRSLPKIFRISLALILAGMVMGHLARKDRYSFPFVHWHMYTRPDTKKILTRVDVRAKTSRGEEFVINTSRLYPSLGLGTLRAYEFVRRTAQAKVADAEARQELLLRSIAATHERLHPEMDLSEIWLVETSESYTHMPPPAKLYLRVILK